jgi:hypothetical protein
VVADAAATANTPPVIVESTDKNDLLGVIRGQLDSIGGGGGEQAVCYTTRAFPSPLRPGAFMARRGRRPRSAKKQVSMFPCFRLGVNVKVL